MLKVPISSNFFILPSDPIFHARNFGEKNFDLDKKRFFYEVLKPENPILLQNGGKFERFSYCLLLKNHLHITLCFQPSETK